MQLHPEGCIARIWLSTERKLGYDLKLGIVIEIWCRFQHGVVRRCVQCIEGWRSSEAIPAEMLVTTLSVSILGVQTRYLLLRLVGRKTPQRSRIKCLVLNDDSSAVLVHNESLQR